MLIFLLIWRTYQFFQKDYELNPFFLSKMSITIQTLHLAFLVIQWELFKMLSLCIYPTIQYNTKPTDSFVILDSLFSRVKRHLLFPQLHVVNFFLILNDGEENCLDSILSTYLFYNMLWPLMANTSPLTHQGKVCAFFHFLSNLQKNHF